MSGNSCIMELFGFCKGGNFNIHIWAWFGLQTSVIFMKILTIQTLNLRLLTLQVYIAKNRMPVSSAEIFEDPSIYSVDPDQTASIGSVRSVSTLYASIFMLTNKQTFFDAVILLVF